MPRIHTLNIVPMEHEGKKRYFVVGEDGSPVSDPFVHYENAVTCRSELIDQAVREAVQTLKSKGMKYPSLQPDLSAGLMPDDSR